MTHGKNSFVVAAMVLGCVQLSVADTVAWYRFEEGTPGLRMTTTTKVVNTAKPGSYEGVPYANMANSTTSADSQYEAYFPEYSAAMGERFVVFDPVAGVSYANAASFHQGASAFKSDGGYVNVAHDDDLDLQTMTVEMFVRVPEGGLDDILPAIIRVGSTTGNGIWSLQTRYARGQIFSRIFQNEASSASIVLGNAENANALKLADGKWHHLALTADEANTTLAIYVDYRRVYQNKAFKGFYYAKKATGAITIGANATNKGRNFVGDIDEVRISDVALEPSQFLRLKTTDPVAPAVDADTRVYLPFELGDVAPRLLANLNMATNGLTNVDWAESDEIATTATGATSIQYVNNYHTVSADVAASRVRAGLDDDGYTNGCALAVVTNIPDAVSTVLRIRNENLELLATNLTVELFFKTPGKIIGGATKDSQTLIGCSKLKMLINQSNGKLLGRGVKPGGDTGKNYVGDITSAERVDDGLWHHAAYVYDAEAHICSFYVDYRLQGYVAGTNAVLGQKEGEPRLGLLIGSAEVKTSTSSTGTQGFDGLIDDVRVTQRALRPGEFLRTRPVRLAEAMFDGSTDLVAGDGSVTAGERVAKAGGSEPSLVSPSPFGEFFYDGETAQDRRENSGALAIDHGSLCWVGHDLSATDFSIEFFGRFSGADALCNFIRLADADDEGDNTCFLIYGRSNGSVSLRVLTADKFGGKSVTKEVGTWSASLGRHHYALTFESVSTSTVVKAYVDRRLVIDKTIPGELLVPKANSLLSFGGRDTAAGYVGTVDSLRITERILKPEEFMRKCPTGLVMVVR